MYSRLHAIACVSLAIVVIAVVVGCGGGQRPSPSPGASTPTVAPTATASATVSPTKTQTWTLAGPMTEQRLDGASVTLLGDGRVLIAGGVGDAIGPFSSAELFDPKTGTFEPTGAMAEARAGHTATLLENGRVLVTGCGYEFNRTELYDPGSGAFKRGSATKDWHCNGIAVRLRDGSVLVAGGLDPLSSSYLRAAEIYDPTTGAFRQVGSMKVARQHAQAVLLKDGRRSRGRSRPRHNPRLGRDLRPADADIRSGQAHERAPDALHRDSVVRRKSAPGGWPQRRTGGRWQDGRTLRS